MYVSTTKDGKSYVNQNKVRTDLLMLAVTLKGTQQRKMLKIIQEWSDADEASREAYNNAQESDVITS